MSYKGLMLQEYAKAQEHYVQYTKSLKQLLERLLETRDMPFHTIVGRVKTIESLHQKLEKGNGKYHTLGEVTDLAGLRIVTYFADDVDLIAKIMEDEFVIVKEHSVDKRALLAEDRFGYLSLHYVIELKSAHLSHPEYQAFRGMRAEVQIRSILQHAWAEIEHDLGYKIEEKLPRDIRRSFSRVAGLLETADLEFVNIRNKLKSLEEVSVHEEEPNS